MHQQPRVIASLAATDIYLININKYKVVYHYNVSIQEAHASH